MSSFSINQVDLKSNAKVFLFDSDLHEDIKNRFGLFKAIYTEMAHKGQKCLLLFDREGYRRYGGDIVSFFRKNMSYALSVWESGEDCAEGVYEENDDIRCVLTIGTSVINVAKSFCHKYKLPLFSLLTVPNSDEILVPRKSMQYKKRESTNTETCLEGGVVAPEAVFVDLSLPLIERDLQRAYGFLGKAVLACFEYSSVRARLNQIIKENLFFDFSKDAAARLHLMLLELSAVYAESGVYTAADSMLAVLSEFTQDSADYAFTVSSLIASIYRQVLTSNTQIVLPASNYRQFVRLTAYGFDGGECLNEKAEAGFTLPDLRAELTKMCQVLNLIAPSCLNLPLPLDEVKIKDCLFLSCTLYPAKGLMYSLYLNGYIA